MKRVTGAVIATLIAISFAFIFTLDVPAQNKPADDHHHAKVFNFTNVDGSRYEDAEKEINLWLADKKNKAAEPTILFCYNVPQGSLLVTVIWKDGETKNPYQVKFFPITSSNREKSKNKKKKSLEEQLNEFLVNVTLKRVWQETASDGRGMMFLVYQK